MKKIINFKKQRELGDILTDTFAFIRSEWKPLFGMIFKIAGPALIIVLIAYIYYMQTTLGSNDFFGSNDFSFGFLIALIFLFIAGLIYNSLLYGTVIGYIKSYIKNEGEINKVEISSEVKSKFPGLFGMSILVGLMAGFGFLLCLIPGIYLAVTLSTVYCIYIFEGKDVTDSISYCFNLIKENWWMTFATLLVMGILYYILLIIFQIPQYIYFFIKAFTSSQVSSVDPADMFDWVYVALSSVGIIAQYLLLTIMVICTVFVYFNLNEKKNFTGTMETIESLGDARE